MKNEIEFKSETGVSIKRDFPYIDGYYYLKIPINN